VLDQGISLTIGIVCGLFIGAAVTVMIALKCTGKGKPLF